MRKSSFLLLSPLAALLACLPLACERASDERAGERSQQDDGKGGGEDGGDEATEARHEDDKADENASNPFAAMAGNPFAAMLGRKLDEPGPYDPPRQSPDFDAERPHLRVLNLKGSVSELEGFGLDSLMGGGGSLTTRSVLDALGKLADEEQLSGLVLRVGPLAVDMARAAQLRRALLEFKGDGARQLLCHAEGLDNGSTYLLSACDELVLAPLGSVMIPGPVATPIHIKGLLDEFEVEADMLHIGAFKGAAEPLTREAPSPEMIETLEAVIGGAHANLVAGVAAASGRSEDEARALIDQAMFTAEQAREAGLIDGVEVWEAFLSRVSQDGERGWKQVKLGGSPLADASALPRFLGLTPPKRPSEPHVALVYAVGGIIDGRGQGALGARQEIASGQLVPVLDRLAADDAVFAVVLRIDSGGGSARASEQIWYAVTRLRESKPVVVSMAGVAASGGYYIASNANRIFAEADTLTGSIGVVGGKLVFGRALEDLGIKHYTVGVGARATLMSPMERWSEDERARVRETMEHTYARFIERVATGRAMTPEAVDAVAQGRVWTGADAKQRGLVDEIGGLDAAIAEAQNLAMIDPSVELEVYPGEPTIKDIFASFDQLVAVEAGLARADGLTPALGSLLDGLAASVGPEGLAWVAALRHSVGLVAQLRGSTVWAVEWTMPAR